jgi:hypothetical protein
MYNNDTDMLFPSRAIPKLRDLRDEAWRHLIDEVVDKEQTSLDHLGFVLLMIQLGGCTNCHADSYRAMRGCTMCAQQTIRRFRGSDQELAEKFDEAKNEMKIFIEERNS